MYNKGSIVACVSCFTDLHTITRVIIFKHKCHFQLILRWALHAKNLKERGSLNAVFSFANTAHQIFLIIIRVFQI